MPPVDDRGWLGDPAASTRRARVPSSAAAFAARAHGARPLPVACAKILTLTCGDDFVLPDVVSTLEGDPPLAARVLKVVNSSAFALRTRCTSVRQAAVLLGRRGVRGAVMAGAMLEVFPGQEGREWHALHGHATRVATLARHLAPEWRLPADEMFTAAFLHDIGKWVLLDLEPDYRAALVASGSSAEGTLDEERGMFGFDHAELGEHMLSAWSIPQPIPRIVGLHHDPADAYAGRPALALRVAVLRLANLLAHSMAPGAGEPDYDALAAAEPLTYLGISSASLRERHAFLREELAVGDAPREGRQAAGRRERGTPAPRARTREAEVCDRCDGASYGVRCARCDARLCDLHTPDPGRVCDVCERQFAARVSGTLMAGSHVALATAGAGLAVGAALVGLGGGAWGAAPLGLGLGLAVLGTWQRWSTRRLFLRGPIDPA